MPTFSACLFAKATCLQWIRKRQKNWNEENTSTKPGDMISVDQLVSPTPGLIGKLTEILTRNRYKYATVFVDQYSGLGYVYLQKTATADENFQVKKYFEAYCKQHGLSSVRAYHADNGIFRSRKWVD